MQAGDSFKRHQDRWEQERECTRDFAIWNFTISTDQLRNAAGEVN